MKFGTPTDIHDIHNIVTGGNVGAIGRIVGRSGSQIVPYPINLSGRRSGRPHNTLVRVMTIISIIT